MQMKHGLTGGGTAIDHRSPILEPLLLGHSGRNKQ